MAAIETPVTITEPIVTEKNKFAEEFSVTEAVAVKQLKDALPEILKEALGTEDAYILWGVPLDKSSDDARIDVILIKFLRARNMEIPAAKEMLINTLKWRKEYKTDGILDEEFDTNVFSDNVGFIHGKDKEGRPVTYNFYGGIDQDIVFGDIDKFIRWRVQLMERGVQAIDFVHTDAMIQVHDYKGASVFGRTQNTKEATNRLIKLMQDNYPEFLASKLFVNVPRWGSMIFKLLTPLLSPATLSKFNVSSSSEVKQTLLTFIDQDQLPPIYAKDL
ncbi:CRAL-TRIO domain-containing protein [Mycotypha africana]|uniref:CRAL-TRIO domain-containing protein n=1 Tax=Mycotypha africana TaxID=64632 RepID=UPI002301F0C3|nr:CRAL-TRIO domain-containing protein [Mycotypha africana]KAI8988040.1 CRAL-TRIO domain-containing protein [Mycotypha africana]